MPSGTQRGSGDLSAEPRPLPYSLPLNRCCLLFNRGCGGPGEPKQRFFAWEMGRDTASGTEMGPSGGDGIILDLLTSGSGGRLMGLEYSGRKSQPGKSRYSCTGQPRPEARSGVSLGRRVHSHKRCCLSGRSGEEKQSRTAVRGALPPALPLIGWVTLTFWASTASNTKWREEQSFLQGNHAAEITWYT